MSRLTDSSLEGRIRQTMADVLGLDPGAIGDATSMRQVASWDSLNHVNLVLALEQEFEVSLDVGEIETMLSYAEILSVLERKVGPGVP